MANKPDKGKKGGSCNRTACQMPNADWYNRATGYFYCRKCAELLNECNRDINPPLFDMETNYADQQ